MTTVMTLDDFIVTRDSVKEAKETPKPAKMGCDSKGCNAVGNFTASSDGSTLRFCGHHIRQSSVALVASGWQITPSDYALRRIDNAI